ncbi:hypothetical protein [Ornithinimicrobium sediminis]|uniref:hypothetical protein n=1 Tax=Ornithinimicrobium sediminis TaxID=2904603 RepID=UPI001E51A14F|nr:hypothetical protein [Ornithinimicrobium sediminis]MCE0488302.1 hypothetical protein [Ornithinimicrobium sediminis]
MSICHYEGLTRSFEVTTCRDRVLQVLSFVDDEGPVVPEALRRLVDETTCGQAHQLHYAARSRWWWQMPQVSIG